MVTTSKRQIRWIIYPSLNILKPKSSIPQSQDLPRSEWTPNNHKNWYKMIASHLKCSTKHLNPKWRPHQIQLRFTASHRQTQIKGKDNHFPWTKRVLTKLLKCKPLHSEQATRYRQAVAHPPHQLRTNLSTNSIHSCREHPQTLWLTHKMSMSMFLMSAISTKVSKSKTVTLMIHSRDQEESQ